MWMSMFFEDSTWAYKWDVRRLLPVHCAHALNCHLWESNIVLSCQVSVPITSLLRFLLAGTLPAHKGEIIIHDRKLVRVWRGREDFSPSPAVPGWILMKNTTFIKSTQETCCSPLLFLLNQILLPPLLNNLEIYGLLWYIRRVGYFIFRTSFYVLIIFLSY